MSSPVTIVVVEDQASTLFLIERAIKNLGPGVISKGFTSSTKAMLWIEENPRPDLLLLDVHLPEIDGIEFARRFRRHAPHKNVPILFLTEEADLDIRFEALKVGAVDYLLKPIVPMELKLKLTNLIDITRAAAANEARLEALEQRLISQLEELEARERDGVIVLLRALEQLPNRPATREDRVAILVNELAACVGLASDEQKALVVACGLRDIGYVNVDAAILRQSAPLEPDEMSGFRRHTEAGYSILAATSTPLFEIAADIARHHHERYDGQGYPDGKRGEAISINSRIVALADQYDAWRNPHGHRPALSHEEAMKWVLNERGAAFDPQLVDALMSLPQVD
jgi:two-component system, response regulator RpfG